MDFKTFKSWIEHYPFIRMQIRESMMPKLWTLKPDFALKQYLNTNEKNKDNTQTHSNK